MNSKNEADKKIRVWARLSPPIRDLLVRRAADEGVTGSELITRALTLYLTKDVTDESLLIAKMSETLRAVQDLSSRLEVGQKLDIEWLQYSLMFLPELPRDEKERRAVMDRAAKRAGDFILSFRRRMKMMPRFLESIFGVMLEEDGSVEEPR